MSGRYLLVLLPLLAVSTAYNHQFQQQQNQQQRPIQRSCPGNLPLSKLMINQSGYIQYVHYFTEIPDISSFTLQYWFNLIDTNRTSTMFDYTRIPSSSPGGKSTDTILIQLERGNPQKWNFRINDNLVSSVLSPPAKAGEWHHMIHSWDSKTGWWSVYMDGTILEAKRSSVARGVVVPGGGDAVSGQRQNTLHDGMDQREGLEGWFTLLQMSHRPLLYPFSDDAAALVSRLASQCDGESHGEILSWSRTPRKGYGGIMETPSQKVCGHF